MHIYISLTKVREGFNVFYSMCVRYDRMCGVFLCVDSSMWKLDTTMCLWCCSHIVYILDLDVWVGKNVFMVLAHELGIVKL